MEAIVIWERVVHFVIFAYLIGIPPPTNRREKKLDGINDKNAVINKSRSSTLQNNKCMVTYLLSHKPS